jgi:hypothetical protein
MQRNLIGAHLLRVRIKTSLFERLQEIADEETERLSAHVTVSDLVRQACLNAILTYDAMQKLALVVEQDGDGDMDDDDDGDGGESDEGDDVVVPTRPPTAARGAVPSPPPRALVGKGNTAPAPFRVAKLGN